MAEYATARAPIAPAGMSLDTWRCTKCGRILARMNLVQGVVEIKCMNCHRLHLLESNQPTLHLVQIVKD